MNDAQFYRWALNAVRELRRLQGFYPQLQLNGAARAQFIVEEINNGTDDEDLAVALGVTRERIRQIYRMQSKINPDIVS